MVFFLLHIHLHWSSSAIFTAQSLRLLLQFFSAYPFLYCPQILLQTLPISWFILFSKLLRNILDKVGPAQTSAEPHHESWQFNTILYLTSYSSVPRTSHLWLLSFRNNLMWDSFQKALETQTDCITPCAIATCCWFLQRALIKLWGSRSLYKSCAGEFTGKKIFLPIFFIILHYW